MDQYKELVEGQVVRSLTGRDKGKFQLVLRLLDKDYVMVVDGKRRKLENPKKKKIKHLQKTKTIFELSEVSNDCHIRKLLKEFVNDKEVH
ncbi:KOW domain-containing RNA-binding protein [Lagierella sp.]|uniref:KOW domain-containing RNA-binding protein n=1 Tax=Lagierella sp. TaxID=2849657 RepID=UPI00260D1119|nr:KOW domain-containing RNA-binding protein [Lagierella sp.]